MSPLPVSLLLGGREALLILSRFSPSLTRQGKGRVRMLKEGLG